MKVILHLGGSAGFAALVLAGAVVSAPAEEPARSRGTPIIFSAPKSDAVSTNLNALRTPPAPLRNLEADLKKPFEFFDASGSAKSYRPPDQKFRPQAPQLNKKQLKDQLHDRAEQAFLSLEPQDDGLFNLLDDTPDPYKKQPKTSLDRYYDRLDQSRAASTNRTSYDGLFGDKSEKDKERRDEFGFEKKKSANLLDDERGIAARNIGLMSNGYSSGQGYFSDPTKFQKPGDFFSAKADTVNDRIQPQAETRLEGFKRLLEGPNYAPRDNSAPHDSFASPASVFSSTAPRPVHGVVSPTWYSTKPTTKTPPANAFATSAGLVGTPGVPHGLQEFGSAPNVSTPFPPPPQAKPAPAASFNIPKRRF